MSSTANLSLVYEIEKFKLSLDTLELVSRARKMQGLHDLLVGHLVGEDNDYFSMDGVNSPINKVLNLYGSVSVAAQSLIWDFLSKCVPNEIVPPSITSRMNAPKLFVENMGVLKHTKIPFEQKNQAQCAHQVCAYLLLNDNAKVVFDLGAYASYGGVKGRVEFVRGGDYVSVLRANVFHNGGSIIKLVDMNGYRALFNAVIMAMFEVGD